MPKQILTMLGAALVAVQSAPAQVLYGSIVGNVKDQTDAAVAGAMVTTVNRETAQSRQSVTNELGGYNFPTLQAGRYELRVTKEGFRTSTSEVTVTINSVQRADLTLQLGAVTESVLVTAATAALQTDRSEVRSEMTSTEFQNL